MDATRRNLLSGTSAIAVAGVLASCAPGSTPQTVTTAVIDAIQAAMATACGYIPNVITIIGLLGEFPALAGATTIASAMLSAVEAFLCAQYKAAVAAPTSGKLMGKLSNGKSFEIHGYHVVNGAIVAF